VWLSSSPRAQNARCFGEDLGRVRGEVDDPVGDDDVGGAALERELLDVAVAEQHVCEAVLVGEARGLGEVGAPDSRGFVAAAGGVGETWGVELPEVEYARSGDLSIAYQVVGDGPVDPVYEGSTCATIST
jgi:hypothetical protein